MTDLFLILYLTAIASAPATSILTVDDFSQLKSMHETLQVEKVKSEQGFQEKLLQAEKEKNDVAAKLAAEQARVKEAESALQTTAKKFAQIDQDLRLKDSTLKEKEQILAKLDQTIKDKEFSWQKKEADYKSAVEANLALAQELQAKAKEAQQAADQMQKNAIEAAQRAEAAKADQQQALLLKDAALKDKEAAQQKAQEALKARSEAEAAKEAAQKAAEAANKTRAEAEEKARQLAIAIEGIKQDSDLAYQKNVRPLLQQLNVTYEEEISQTINTYRKNLNLLPVKINEQVYVIFPSQHIGFSRRDDTAPRRLEVQYKGSKIDHVLINKTDDLVAVPLPGFKGDVATLHPADAGIQQFMPVLLALRDNADVSITNLFRGLADDYCVINRDNIEPGENGVLVHFVKGWRGTGKRAERILQGDQLVDLNARLIGIAKDADHILRIDTLKGWEKLVLKESYSL